MSPRHRLRRPEPGLWRLTAWLVVAVVAGGMCGVGVIWWLL